jgi:hypothetical protein
LVVILKLKYSNLVSTLSCSVERAVIAETKFGESAEENLKCKRIYGASNGRNNPLEYQTSMQCQDEKKESLGRPYKMELRINVCRTDCV